MQFQSIPMVTSDDVLGRAIMRDKDAQKETLSNVKLEADVYVRDAFLTTEGTPGALLPRPVLYLRGHVNGVRGAGLPDGVEYGSFGGQDAPSEGTDVYVRYEFTDLEAMRLMMHGIGRTDWPGLDPRITANVHQLPLTADITVAHKEGVSVPFIICDIDNPAGLVTNRKECGYDYADYVQWSPSAVRELGPEVVQQMDTVIKNLDRVVVPEVQPEVEQGQTTAYDSQMFRSIFDNEAVADVDEKHVAEQPSADDQREPMVEDSAEETVDETPEEKMRREAEELGARVVDDLFHTNDESTLDEPEVASVPESGQVEAEPSEAPAAPMTENQGLSDASSNGSLLDMFEDEEEDEAEPMSDLDASIAALDDGEDAEERKRRERTSKVTRAMVQQTDIEQAEAGDEGMSL